MPAALPAAYLAGGRGQLRRLNTDYIDIYFIHHFDAFTPLEETLRVLDDLVRQGKILYPAARNFAAWQVEKALGISAGWAGHRLAASSPCITWSNVRPM
jgi:aryl-alcohol dehydrogenase-like predicted oxidoreductase